MALYLTGFIRKENNFDELIKIVEEYSTYEKAKEKLDDIVYMRREQNWDVDYQGGEALQDDFKRNNEVTNINTIATINEPNTANSIIYTISLDAPPWKDSPNTPMFPESIDMTNEIREHSIKEGRDTSKNNSPNYIQPIIIGVVTLTLLYFIF